MIDVYLFGFGRFGKQYYNELIGLQHQGLIRLNGVVTNSIGSDTHTSEGIPIVAFATFDYNALGSKTLAIIATPSSTHAELASHLLCFCHVLIEKPVATSEAEVAKLKSRIMQNNDHLLINAQIFRFHPLTKWLFDNSSGFQGQKLSIESSFVNCTIPPNSFLDRPLLEMQHLIDVFAFVFNYPKVANHFVKQDGHLEVLSLASDNFIAQFECGWDTDRSANSRNICIQASNVEVKLDFVESLVEIYSADGSIVKHFLPSNQSLVRQQIAAAAVLISETTSTVSVDSTTSQSLSALKTTSYILDAYRAIRPVNGTSRKRVAVIGGGIFGASCALELASTFDICVFEKNQDFLLEASLSNQWRHHSGFHYPLSFGTVAEIVATKKEFESLYSEAINHEHESYYFVSSKAIEIPPRKYLNTCDYFGLNYIIVPPPDFIVPGSVSLCLKTDEKIYDISKLRRLINCRLSDCRGVETMFSTTVHDIAVLPSNKKRLSFSSGSLSVDQEDFDYVIDCTNATTRFTFPGHDRESKVRFEIVELLQISLDLPNHAYTVIDGPFVSLTSMGDGRHFFLSHRDYSLHSRLITPGKVPEIPPDISSLRTLMISAAQNYFKIPNDVEVVKSWYATKSISPYTNEVWERPTIIKDHSFGIYSIIGGKILTAVSNAKEIASRIIHQP
jgi:predicted dehydrogenase